MAFQKFIPHNNQKEPMKLLSENDFFGLFMFPGSGKTVLSLDKVYQFKEKTLVVVPLSILYTTWMNEHRKWGFSARLKLILLHGPDKDANFHKTGGIYLINPEGIKWLLDKVKTTKKFPWTSLIVDESVKFKNHKSGRFKDLSKMLKSFKRRYILCGNPMPTHYLDLWAQIFILDLGKRLGTSWYAFRNRYFYPTDYKRFNWILKPEAKEEIVAAIGDIVYFLEPDGEIPLPKRVINDVIIDIPREKYKSMEQKLFAELDNGDNVLASNKTAALMKCWQIANGFMYETYNVIEDGKPVFDTKGEILRARKTHYIHNKLATVAKDIVEGLQGEPICIAYHFKEDLVRLMDTFPKARIVATGCKPSVIKQAEKDWNNNKIDVLIVYVSKFSHGLNLQYGKGHHLMFYCLTYNFDTYDQFIRRFERQGAKFKEVIIHRFICRDTIHEAIVENLETKGIESRDFLLALTEYRRKHNVDT